MGFTKSTRMVLSEFTAEGYRNLVQDYTVGFETVDFNLLNAQKCQKVLFLVFDDANTIRFGLIGGIFADGRLKIPFSAPYSLLTEVRKRNKVLDYQEAVKSLIEHCGKRGDVKRISFTLPPQVYHPTMVSTLENSLFVCGFKVEKVDLNYHFELNEFDDRYEFQIDIKARQKLRSALKQGLVFERTDGPGVQEVYEIIKNNRETKGYPLHLSLEDVLHTAKIIKADYFMVRDSVGGGVAAAFVLHVARGIVQVIYWGNTAGSDHLKPMNFLAYKVLEYYKASGIKILDIGPATDNSMPNYGLCDFKQGIGCVTNSKYSFEYVYNL